ncbi:hypothetical protein [Methylobrevis pamukkalensis]|nr:hypothetical protein [Methylobrevis pamukkalensis]
MAFGDPDDPNWPCQQRKVPELSLGAVWTGPDISAHTATWRDDKETRDLVGLLAARRTTLDEAQAAIDAFAERAAGARNEKMISLFAGLYSTLDIERSDVMNGIDRFARKQREMAAELRKRTSAIDKMRDAPDADPMAINAAYDELNFETRVFGDRQRSLTFVCEVPVIIEQRTFRLGKMIADKISTD